MLQSKVVVKELGEKPVPIEARTTVGAWLVRHGANGTFGLRLNESASVVSQEIEGRERVQHLDISKDAKTLAISVLTPISGEMHDCNCDLLRIPPEPLGDIWTAACESGGDPRETENPDDGSSDDHDQQKSGQPIITAWRAAHKAKFKTQIVLATLSSFAAENGGRILWPEHRDEIRQKFRAAGHPEYADVGNKSIGSGIFGFSKKAGFIAVAIRKSHVTGMKCWTLALTEKAHDFLAGRISVKGKTWKSKSETRLARVKSGTSEAIDAEIIQPEKGNSGGSVKGTMFALVAQVMSVSTGASRDGAGDEDDYDPNALASIDELDAQGISEVLEPHKDQVRALRQIEGWKKKILGQLPVSVRKAFRIAEEARDAWESVLDPDR
ncbi:MAG: hypothetical protein HZA95_00370 [Candidatus Vogelbacteria bacterium]|nr:hypothetical protein [Candidatus Vogelbacteria bacterium]